MQGQRGTLNKMTTNVSGRSGKGQRRQNKGPHVSFGREGERRQIKGGKLGSV